MKDKPCPYCEKLYSKNGIGTHIWRVHGAGVNFNANNDYSKRNIWNKGLSKDTDSRLSLSGKKISVSLTGKPGNPHTAESKLNLSILAKNRGFGGVNRSKKISYKGLLLGSSYEVILAKILDKINVKWELPKRFFYKDLNGVNHSYTADFYLTDFDLFLDPKNDFLINNINPRLGYKDTDKIKWVCEQNNIKVIVLSLTQLNEEEIKRLIS